MHGVAGQVYLLIKADVWVLRVQQPVATQLSVEMVTWDAARTAYFLQLSMPTRSTRASQGVWQRVGAGDSVRAD